MMRESLARPFELKAISDQGTFSGYGSVFGVEDSYSDIVMPGAFTRSLGEHKAKGTMPLLLWQHDTDKPIGVYDSMREDEKGLYVEGRFALGTQAGREAHELMGMKAITGLSIGFQTRRYEIDKEQEVRKLIEVDLWEVSPVSFPANQEARIEAVKMAIENPREFESQLRDVLGLTQAQAKRLMAAGYEAMTARDVPGARMDVSEWPELLSLMRGLATRIRS